MEGEALKGHLEMLVLAIVGAGPAHGYAIIDALRRRSDGVFDLPEGTMYPVLHRLEQRGLIASHWTSDGRRRRVYQLTPAGRRALTQHKTDWFTFTKAVAAVLEAV